MTDPLHALVWGGDYRLPASIGSTGCRWLCGGLWPGGNRSAIWATGPHSRLATAQRSTIARAPGTLNACGPRRRPRQPGRAPVVGVAVVALSRSPVARSSQISRLSSIHCFSRRSSSKRRCRQIHPQSLQPAIDLSVGIARAVTQYPLVLEAINRNRETLHCFTRRDGSLGFACFNPDLQFAGIGA
jgi:hypothetical protein